MVEIYLIGDEVTGFRIRNAEDRLRRTTKRRPRSR